MERLHKNLGPLPYKQSAQTELAESAPASAATTEDHNPLRSESLERTANAGLAQSVRASVLHTEGRPFKSDSPHQIPLTRGHVTILDPEDFERYSHLKWSAQVTQSGHVYAYRNEPGPNGKLRNVFLHRLIMEAGKGLHVDHIDGKTLDNRRSNLRLATPAQNVWNSRRREGNLETKYVGVRQRPSGRFFGQVTAYGEIFTTRTFSDLARCARARDILCKALHGEFAVLNFNQ